MFKNYQFRRFDYISVLLVIAIIGIGLVAIGSATLVHSDLGTTHFVKRQLLGAATGLVIMLITALIDYRLVGKLTPLVYLVNIGLLIAVLKFGSSKNNSVRWLALFNSGIKIQPSEFTKLFMILVLAKYFDFFKEKLNKLYVIIPGFLLISVPIYLVKKQPDLSTSIVLLAVFCIIIFVAGLDYRYIAVLMVVMIPMLIWGYHYIQQPDQKLLTVQQRKRVMAMIKPEEYRLSSSWQTESSIKAIGSGQLAGKGLYKGKLHQYNYLPEPQTDFIFSIIGEEFGFVGCVIVLVLLFLLMIRILYIVKDSPDLMGKLIGAGLVGVILVQIFINVGVATGIVPNTGIPLPFISYGVSSLWTNMICLGVVLNISMQRLRPNMKHSEKRRRGEV